MAYGKTNTHQKSGVTITKISEYEIVYNNNNNLMTVDEYDFDNSIATVSYDANSEDIYQVAVRVELIDKKTIKIVKNGDVVNNINVRIITFSGHKKIIRGSVVFSSKEVINKTKIDGANDANKCLFFYSYQTAASVSKATSFVFKYSLKNEADGVYLYITPSSSVKNTTTHISYSVVEF